MTADRDRQYFTLPDGRRLCFAEIGEPDAFPVLSLHGTPGCRLNRRPNPAVYAEAGVRLITYDRPGYGDSDRLPGRQVVHCVDDITALLDHLGVDEFSAAGGSGGGPHLLAVAARLGPRIRRAECAVGIVPYGTPDFDWFDGMDPLNVKEFQIALEGEEPYRTHILGELAAMDRRHGESDGPGFIDDDWQLSDADRAVLEREDLRAAIRAAEMEMCRNGPDGWVDDGLCFTDPDWGFDLDEISIPVRITWGLSDVLVPAAHGRWLSEHVPHAIPDPRADEGHMGDPDKLVDELRWLAGAR